MKKANLLIGKRKGQSLIKCRCEMRREGGCIECTRRYRKERYRRVGETEERKAYKTKYARLRNLINQDRITIPGNCERCSRVKGVRDLHPVWEDDRDPWSARFWCGECKEGLKRVETHRERYYEST